MPSSMEETDLTYEGIETSALIFQYLSTLSEETDLTYEGIETLQGGLLTCPAARVEETDLTYEGIETQSTGWLMSWPSR